MRGRIYCPRVDAVDQLKSYRILAKIGAGGMGEVFLAEHLRLGRKVAIKFLSRALSAHTHAVSRFFAEARAAAQLNSPGIVQVFDCDANPDGRAYIVMEYLEGETLAERLERGAMAPDFGGDRRDWHSDRGRPVRGARTGDRPPRPQAREHLPDRRPR